MTELAWGLVVFVLITYHKIKASDLIALSGEKDVHAVCEGMLKNMLEGDRIVNGSADHPSKDLEIAYYCDNLSESRRRLY